jgi:conjugative transposon TraJ protein
MYVGPDGNGDREKWYQYTHPDDPNDQNEGLIGSVGNDIKFAMAKISYNFRNAIRQWMSEILQLLYEAAALCINTLRVFNLLLLAILGPLVFGISVFDGFRHTLGAWLARYINVFLWLPVANLLGTILGKIQENMIQLDINQIQANGDTFFNSTDTAYLIFLVIGIVGYFTVPSIASHIVQAGGGDALLYRTSQAFSNASRSTVNVLSSGASVVPGMAGSMLERALTGPIAPSTAAGPSRSPVQAAEENSYGYQKLKGE